MHGLLASLLVAATMLVFAPGAMAGQILFAHSEGRDGADIWIMNDDGSNARPFITRSQIPDGAASTLSDPAVDESTGAVLFNGFVGTFGGTNGEAVYVLKDGQITRLSRGGGQSGEGTTADSEPQPFGNGSFIFRGQSCTGTTCGVTVFETQSMSDTAADGQLETRSQWPTACDGSGSLGTPAPNPVDPGQVAYGGCIDPSSFSQERMLAVSGPNRAGEKIIAIDDQPHEQPTWRHDGGQVAAVERSSSAGLYVYDPTDDTRDKRRVLAVQSFDSSLSSLTFMGNETLLFDRTIGDEKRLYTIGTGCTDCNADTDAAVLKADPGQSSFDPEWTPRGTLQPPGGSPVGPDPVGPTPIGSGPSGVGPSPRATFARTQSLALGRLRLRASCSAACQLTTRGTSVAAGKRKFGLRTVSRNLAAGQQVALSIRLSQRVLRAARRALRSGKRVSAELVLSAYYDGGSRVGGPIIRKIRLR